MDSEARARIGKLAKVLNEYMAQLPDSDVDTDMLMVVCELLVIVSNRGTIDADDVVNHIATVSTRIDAIALTILNELVGTRLDPYVDKSEIISN